MLYTDPMAPRSLPDRVTALATLDDPTRRAMFDLVARAATTVSRDAVSVPERRYDLVGGLLARAVAESIDNAAPVQEVLPVRVRPDQSRQGAATGTDRRGRR